MAQYGRSVALYLRNVALDELEYEDSLYEPPPRVKIQKPDPEPEPEKPPMPASVTKLIEPQKQPEPHRTLPDTIQIAALRKVEEEMKPVTEKVTKLQMLLGVYEDDMRAETERRVVNAVLDALGQERASGGSVPEAHLEKLREALRDVCKLVGGVLPFEAPSSSVRVHLTAVPEPEPESAPVLVAPVVPPPPPTPTPKTKSKLEPQNLHMWPKLPRLRAAMKYKPLVIVGGLVINEKLALCASRFGIKPVWHEAEGDSMRSADAMVARIRAGGPCGVIILEGLVGHKTTNKIVDACKAVRMPWQYADKGGVASIEAALNDIERKLSA